MAAPRLALAATVAAFTVGLLAGRALTLWQAARRERHAEQSRRRAAAWRSALLSVSLVAGGALLAVAGLSAARVARRTALVDAALPAAAAVVVAA